MHLNVLMNEIGLQNDYKDIMEQISNELIKVHSQTSEIEQNKQEVVSEKAINKEEVHFKNEPLAIIKTIEQNSLAERSGLKEGDYIIQYCSYVKQEGDEPLQMIQKLTKEFSGDKGIDVIVYRDGKEVLLNLDYHKGDRIGFFIVPY